MSDPPYMRKEYRTTNEPKVHELVRGSFAFVHSAGMRLAPEILVLELMREVFFEKHYEQTRKQDLDPDEKNANGYCLSKEQRAILHALRGRRKNKGSRQQSFFAPAYPSLAKLAWLGKNRERIIYNFLFSGPVSQHLWGRGGPDHQEGKKQQQLLAERVYLALLGGKSCFDDNNKGKDFLAVTLGSKEFDEYRNSELAKNNIIGNTEDKGTIMRTEHDELAARVTEDLLAICEIEGSLPRMQWLQLLMTFLRFSLPMWLLAQMQITRLLHSWLLEAVEEKHIVNKETIEQELAKRNRALLRPTLVATRELFEHIERYMKCRVEVNILLYCLEQARPQELSNKKLTYAREAGNRLTLENLLVLARNASDDIRCSERFKKVAKNSSVQTFLTREGELFSAWRNPLMNGQGKNINEFFRVLYRAKPGDEEGGYLLTPEGRGIKRGFRVFPGQLLLKMATYLADRSKRSGQRSGSVGKLVLQDVEELFEEYGIGFSTAADARPLLMRELQALGLLVGSPDAGSSAGVACPY